MEVREPLNRTLDHDHDHDGDPALARGRTLSNEFISIYEHHARRSASAADAVEAEELAGELAALGASDAANIVERAVCAAIAGSFEPVGSFAYVRRCVPKILEARARRARTVAAPVAAPVTAAPATPSPARARRQAPPPEPAAAATKTLDRPLATCVAREILVSGGDLTRDELVGQLAEWALDCGIPATRDALAEIACAVWDERRAAERVTTAPTVARAPFAPPAATVTERPEAYVPARGEFSSRARGRPGALDA